MQCKKYVSHTYISESTKCKIMKKMRRVENYSDYSRSYRFCEKCNFSLHANFDLQSFSKVLRSAAAWSISIATNG